MILDTVAPGVINHCSSAFNIASAVATVASFLIPGEAALHVVAFAAHAFIAIKGAKVLMGAVAGAGKLSKVDKIINDSAAATKLPVFEVSRSKYPEIAAHHEEAFAAGHPNILTRIKDNQKLVDKNRRQATYPLKGSRPGMQKDEFPYASTYEGGKGASAKFVNKEQNSAHGSDLGKFYLKYDLQDGDKFIVKLVD